MTNQEILQKIVFKKKGCYITITKTKELGQGIIKESDMNIRIGGFLFPYEIK